MNRIHYPDGDDICCLFRPGFDRYNNSPQKKVSSLATSEDTQLHYRAATTPNHVSATGKYLRYYSNGHIRVTYSDKRLYNCPAIYFGQLSEVNAVSKMEFEPGSLVPFYTTFIVRSLQEKYLWKQKRRRTQRPKCNAKNNKDENVRLNMNIL